MTLAITVAWCCSDCPLFDGEWGTCEAIRIERPDGGVDHRETCDDPDDPEQDAWVPTWCPLRSGPVTVELAAEEPEPERGKVE